MATSNVTDLLLLLAGFGSLSETDGTVFRHGTKQQHELVLNLIDIARNHVETRQKCEAARSSPSVIIRVTAAEIERYLGVFGDALAQIESLVLHNDASIVVESEISLIRLTSMLHRHGLVLAHLARIAAHLDKHAPAQIMSELREDVLTGYDTLKSVTLTLSCHAERLMMLQIKQWCLYGTLYSSFREDFFVQRRRSNEYEYSEVDCPRFIDKTVALQIFHLGSMLRNLTHGHEMAVAASREVQRHHEALFASLSYPIDGIALAGVVTEVNESVSQHILPAVLPKSRILSLLAFLRNFYLLENGRFAMQLINTAQDQFHDMRRTAGSLKDNAVHAVLARVVASLDESHHETEDTDVAKLRMVLCREETHATDFCDFLYGTNVRLTYDLAWPINMFLRESDMQEYSRLFNYLVAVRRAHERLHGLWCGRRGNTKANVSDKTWSAANTIRAFVGTLMEYYHADVIKPFSTEFCNTVEIIDDMETLANHHRRMIQSVVSKIMLPNYGFRQCMKHLLTSVDRMISSIRRSDKDVAERCTATLLSLDSTLAELLMEEGVEVLMLKLHNGSSVLDRAVH